MNEHVVVVIPARYGSSRFPGKPLAPILGRPMVEYVYEAAAAAPGVSRVLVATDDIRILRAVEAFGGEAVLTSKECRSGSDRVAEVAGKVDGGFFVNLQGDEPLMDPKAVGQVVSLLKEHPRAIATLKRPLTDMEEYGNPNCVKVVCDDRGFALYFSRSPIPFNREGLGFEELRSLVGIHVGIYGYHRDVLERFVVLPQGKLEVCESLEQLRALEYGIPIRVATTSYISIGVDTPQNLEKVEALLRKETDYGK
jgi:3-deoxy-manno-octulosonate cytidylyltransferase (CMP-KDO synthetase)